MEYLQVEGKEGLVRDPKTDAIININSNELQRRKLVKANRKKQQEEIQNLKNDVSEIKDLLRQLLEKR
jgi:hypothetical protein